MDLASVLGLLLGMILVGLSATTGNLSALVGFFDLSSLLLVLGGSAAAVLLAFPFRDLRSLPAVLRKVFFNRAEDLKEVSEQLVMLSQVARREGLLALEGQLPRITHPTLTLGVQLIVDGTRPEVVESLLRSEMDSMAARHLVGKNVIAQLGRFTPAFGLIGTLIGLILMFCNLSDPEALGPGMATALLTTLYGAILANLVFLPCAEKLGLFNSQELLVMEVILRGVLAIQAGEHPQVVLRRLSTFVPHKERHKIRKAA